MWHILSIFYQNPHIRYIHIYICSIYIYIHVKYYIYIYCIYSIYILHIIYVYIYIYTTHTLYITYSLSILIIDAYALYALQRLHTPWFLCILTSAAHAVPWTLLAHSLHWAIYFAYKMHYLAWLLRKPPLPCHRGGGTIWLGRGGGVGVPAHIYIYIYIHGLLNVPIFHITQPLDSIGYSWSTRWLLFQVMSNILILWDI